jgi:SnoaL-like domain
MTNTMDLAMITDRFAIIDLVNHYFRLVDTKQWRGMDQIFVEDASIQETPDRVIHGRQEILDNFSSFDDSEDILLYHIVGSFTPFINGDTATADIPVRSRHQGVGAREGTFYESLVVLSTQLVRTPDGWRFKHYDWHIMVRLGSLGELYEAEFKKAGRRVVGSGGSVPIND